MDAQDFHPSAIDLFQVIVNNRGRCRIEVHERLPKLKPKPISGICLASPDGAYFDRQDHLGDQDDGRAQIIIVGPMRFAPMDYENAINDHFKDRVWDIESIEFMTNIVGGLNKITLQRGFVSIIFKGR